MLGFIKRNFIFKEARKQNKNLVHSEMVHYWTLYLLPCLCCSLSLPASSRETGESPGNRLFSQLLLSTCPPENQAKLGPLEQSRVSMLASAGIPTVGSRPLHVYSPRQSDSVFLAGDSGEP